MITFGQFSYIILAVVVWPDWPGLANLPGPSDLAGLTGKVDIRIKFRYCDLKHMCEMELPLREKEAYMRGVKKGVKRGQIKNLTKFSSYWAKISGKSKKSDFSYSDFIKGA